MRRSVLTEAILALLVTAVWPATTEAQENRFLKITSPEDKQSYKPRAECKVTGFLQLPDPKADTRFLVIRARIYYPGIRQFAVGAEVLAEPNRLPGKSQFPFEALLKAPSKGGQYLLKVDCLDLKIAKYPQSLVASQSLFIKVQADGDAAPTTIDHNTVTIASPQTTDTYNNTSNIGVTGVSDNDKVKKIRLRFVKNSTIFQEEIVTVAAQAYKGSLPAPMGGWPLSTGSVEAQGLNEDGDVVPGELATKSIKIVEE